MGVGEQMVAKKAAQAEVNQERSEPLCGEWFNCLSLAFSLLDSSVSHPKVLIISVTLAVR